MSLSSSRAKLKSAAQDLFVHWEQVRQTWDDPMSRDFEKRHLTPLEPRIKLALEAMDRVAELVHRARRECEA